jgi:arylsulfatase A-like enzyme
MNTQSPTLSSFLAKGAMFGAAAFSAYAVVEFFFSSVVYRVTRPYAIFTAWHWKLTAILLLGYLFAGVLIGLLAALWARRRDDVREHASDLLEAATAAVLAVALIVNNLTGPGALWLGSVQIASAIFFLAVLLAGIVSPAWRDRLGWVASPWIISLTWLGIGLYASLRLRATPEAGAQLLLAANLLAAGLVAAAAVAWFFGRRARRNPAQRWTLRIARASCAAALLLLLACFGLSFDTPAVGAADSGGASSNRPNVVVIVMDTVRADHLSLNGYSRDTTPNLRALARESVVYSNAFAPSDITLTSHASLFTGMYPSWHNAYCQPPQARYGRELSEHYPTLAEVLHREGYETLGVAANLYLRADFGLERGFDEFRIPRPVPLLPDEDRSVLRYQLRRGLNYVFDTAQFDRLYTFGEDIDREFFSALNQRQRRSDPFFAFLNYMDAHYPYVPPAPYSSRYPGRHPRFTQDDLVIDQDIISKGQGQPADYRPHCESQYDGGIAYIDHQIGQLIEGLKRRGQYDNTMIVITSDHGEAFGERNRVGHANSPYQNLLHVGLLIKYPGARRTGTEAQPVSLIDVAPTALDAVGVKIPQTMQGLSLAGGAPAPRHIFAETFQNPVSHSPDCPDGCVTKVIVEWPLKFIENRTNGKPEFFDLSSDPNEQHNLFATQRERAEALAAHLTEWAKSLPTQSVETKRVNPSIENTLRGNGYVAK